jgi:hypothetical protein
MVIQRAARRLLRKGQHWAVIFFLLCSLTGTDGLAQDSTSAVGAAEPETVTAPGRTFTDDPRRDSEEVPLKRLAVAAVTLPTTRYQTETAAPASAKPLTQASNEPAGSGQTVQKKSSKLKWILSSRSGRGRGSGNERWWRFIRIERARVGEHDYRRASNGRPPAIE